MWSTKTDLIELADELKIDITNKTAEEIESLLAKALWKRENPNKEYPEEIAPMLCEKDEEPISDKKYPSTQWVAEPKLNGMRGIFYINNETIRLTSRNRSKVNFRYEERQDRVPHLVEHWKLCNIKGKTIFDGELVMDKDRVRLNERETTTSRLNAVVGIMNSTPQRSVEIQKREGWIRYIIFDALWLDGEEVANLPYYIRREKLEEWFSRYPKSEFIDLIPVFKDGNYSNLFHNLTRAGGEGIVLKNKYSRYEIGIRSKNWIKFKRFETIDAFITGFVEGQGTIGGLIGSFRVSVIKDGKITEIARVGGLDLETRVKATIRNPDDSISLNPEYLYKVISITGQEITKNKRLAHSRLVEWRPDKNWQDCKI